MNSNTTYDFIIAGAGCAGLSLALHMIRSGQFSGKKVLLVDRDPKQSNDRTWCFWEQGAGLFEPIVHKQWDKLWFHGESFSKELSIHPYRYKMIRGIDFYNYCLREIRQQGNFEILQGGIDRICSEEKTALVVEGREIPASYIFNSILFKRPELAKNDSWLLQHFKGWIIETEEDAFDESTGTLMDFRTGQQEGTAFCYVLPFHRRRALVEYTLFSPDLLQPHQYDEGLTTYIGEVMNITAYRVVEEELGTIPMTSFKFPSHHKNVINIGTAGGRTKGSSGYTFHFIQKHSAALVESIIKTGKPFVKEEPARFGFYDSVLLKVLNKGSLSGKQVFTELFRKNPVDRVFRFLNNESSLAEELKIIGTLPTLPFLKAGIQQFI